jgi:N-acetyl-gamma-glutamyl-phosphate reductase
VTASHAKKRVGVVGARGYVGQELVPLVQAHPHLELAFASSRSEQPVGPADVAQHHVDAIVLAMPNGQSDPYAAAYPGVIVDLSADHRFDGWVYGLPEHHRAKIVGARRIANPGCYATGAQLALEPFLDVIEGVPHVFGVSGYSGAGTSKSDKNDPEKLRDNLIPYALVDHTHEKEVSRHLGRAVAFMPHVAPFFRGITLTVSFSTSQAVTKAALQERLASRYAGEALVKVQDEAPLVRDAANKHGATLGGLSVDAAGRRVALVCTLDNLLKGAATQALQNLNLALGLPEHMGVPT